MHHTIPAVIYARYSSHNQTEQSIEGQLRDAYEYAERNGFRIVHEYIDRAISGTTDNRAEFQQMIADSAKHTFEVVLVWKLDRFARNRYDSAMYKSQLKKHNVRVISVKEGITDSPEGIILEGLLESMAEYYSANLAQNVKRGMHETMLKGKFTGGRIPLGYRVENGRLVADPKTAEVVRYIYRQYASGVSTFEIAETLNRQGITTGSGTPFNSHSFYRTLTNPLYLGKYRRFDLVSEDCAEPLVTQQLFDQVQAVLEKNRRTQPKHKKQERYLLQGKVFCGMCGSIMHGAGGTGKQNTYYRYYACRNKKVNRCCNKRNERKEALEQYVIACTMQYVLSNANITAIADAVVSQYNKECTASTIPELRRTLSRLDADLNKLVDALTEAPKSARARIYERMELLEAQKADLAEDIRKQEIISGIHITKEAVIAWLQTFQSGDPSDPAFRARLIDTFVNAIYLYDDRVLILYNLSTDQSDPIPYAALPESSNTVSFAQPNDTVYEPDSIVFIMRQFGFSFALIK